MTVRKKGYQPTLWYHPESDSFVLAESPGIAQECVDNDLSDVSHLPKMWSSYYMIGAIGLLEKSKKWLEAADPKSNDLPRQPINGDWWNS